jgi:hypothetical protein
MVTLHGIGVCKDFQSNSLQLEPLIVQMHLCTLGRCRRRFHLPMRTPGVSVEVAGCWPYEARPLFVVVVPGCLELMRASGVIHSIRGLEPKSKGVRPGIPQQTNCQLSNNGQR